MYEMRIAMGGGDINSFEKWLKFMQTYKYGKLRLLRDYYYPDCTPTVGTKKTKAAAGSTNQSGGPGYGQCVAALGYFAHSKEVGPQNQEPDRNSDGTKKNKLNEDKSGNTAISCQIAENNIVRDILPKLHEKIKTIGDTHYGKSWYLPVPYFKTKEDLDGNNLVGNFERSWEIVDSSYVEPSYYYSRQIPQSNQFINNGKVSPFVNYDFNFVFSTGNAGSGTYDEAYIQKLNSVITGKDNEVFNFSEYSLDQLCSTKYGNTSIIHAAPQSIDSEYSFLPYAYDSYYDRSLIPFYDYDAGELTYYAANKSEVLGPASIGQGDGQQTTSANGKKNLSPGFPEKPTSTYPTGLLYSYSEDLPLPGVNPLLLPIHTASGFLENTVDGLYGLNYEDNGRFQFAYVKCSTARVFLPPVEETGIIGKSAVKGYLGSKMTVDTQPAQGPKNKTQQKRINQSNVSENMYPAPIAVTPKSISYAQISNRHVYGPWITSLNYIPFRGKIEYEQDDSLVPENFLIPTNFGEFGDFTLSQTSGLEGLNLAAQGRANAIDDFTLFAVEEGSIKVPGAPAITRIGDTLYGLPQVTDISVSVSNSKIDTSYSFKTISPRFNKNNRDVEKNLSKISNKLKKIKFR